MRGYFGVGVEKISKPMNLGALWRTTHAFGGSFLFTIGSPLDVGEVIEGEEMKLRHVNRADTSASSKSVPLFEFASHEELNLPKGCDLVGVELADDAIDLPSFRHPTNAAYILGPERGSLSDEVQARCDLIVKIPTKFCINVGLAGALVMYDRCLQLGGHPEKPVSNISLRRK